MSLKDRIIKAYFSHVYLGPKWMNKLAIIANVLIHDWRVHPYCLSVPEIAALSEESIRTLYRDLDDESIGNLLRYRKTCCMPVGEMKTCCFYNVGKYMTKDELKAQKSTVKQIRAFSKKHKLPFEPEACIYHHGLSFHPYLKEYIADRDIIDAGAYLGDSALIFQMYYKPRKIFSFEPSESNRKAYRETMHREGIDSRAFELIPKGLGKQEDVFYFNDSGDGGNNLHTQGNSAVEIQPLDDFCKNNDANVAVIKADIEGMGL